MTMIFFKKPRYAKPCGWQQHIYVPRECLNKKIVGVIVDEDNSYSYE